MKILNLIKQNPVLIIILTICLILRIYKLDFQSPWPDELFSLTNSASEKSYGYIFRVLESDVHPPLYYYVLHTLFLIFGDSSFLARLVSVIFGMGGLIAVYFLAKELFNKKNIGLIAISLLGLNFFHLYYSQEARMYAMLFFTTTMSFLFLVKFIKNPTAKSALIHAIFASLMINTQFVAVFTLVGEYLILLYFFIKPYKVSQKNFFKYSLLSFVVTIILYIPSLLILKKMSKQTSTWIPEPSRDIFSVMFKDFFGNSEIPIWITSIAILFFLADALRKNQFKSTEINPEDDKGLFAVGILFIWIFTTLIIPFVLSYINLPMIISRYFIHLIPPIILLASAGLYQIKSIHIRALLIIVFIGFTSVDIFLVKDYYNRITKSQFREASMFIQEKRKNDEKIYSPLEVFYAYYLREKNGQQVIQASLNNYVSMLQQNQIQPDSFWYADTDLSEDKPTENTLKVIDSLFIVNESITLYNTSAKHYVNKKDYRPTFGVKKFKPYQTYNGYHVDSAIGLFNDTEATTEISGWAFLKDQSAEHSKISIAVISDTEEIVFPAENEYRPDVTSYFKSPYDLSNSGFKITLDKKKIKPGSYKIGIYIFNEFTKKDGLSIIDKTITVK
nr:glycosyltransferase family 39 protein [uncultured Flavobacterium sp.]